MNGGEETGGTRLGEDRLGLALAETKAMLKVN